MPAIAKKGILYTETPSVENRVVEGNQNPVTSGAVYKELGDTSVNNDLGANISNQIGNLHTQIGRLTQVQSQIVPTASIESGETASKAYSVDDFLVKDGILYKVTKAIAQGDTLTVGTNIAMTTVCGELSSIKSSSTDKWTFKKLTGTDNNVTVPSGVKEFYLAGVNAYGNSINAVTIPIELFNYDEILRFYSYVNEDCKVCIMRTSTENVYSVQCVGTSFAIFGYR